MNRFDFNELASQAEDITDKILRHSKHILPTVARLCLIGTFTEDGIRMFFQWGDQIKYMDEKWGYGYFIASVFVLFNLLAQLIGSGMIIFRYQVPLACLILSSVVILQSIAYGILCDLTFFPRSLSLCGALLFLWAESKEEGRSLFAGVPTLDNNKPKSYMQLFGRILLVLMFITIFKFQFSELIFIFFASILMICVIIGYKTKLSVMVLVLGLTCFNFYVNSWWRLSFNDNFRDFLKYDFFQILSVVGGLLMVVYLGPGGVSLDDYKKRW